MGLKAKLDNLDGVDEALQGLYKDNGGVFVLDVEPVDSYELTDTAGLKSALQKERTSVKEYSEKLKSFDGLDPVQVRDAMDKVEKMKDWKPEEKIKEQITAKVGEVQKQYEEKLNSVQSERDALLNQVDVQIRKTEILNILSEEPYKGASVTLLMPHILSQTKTVKNDDGSFEAVVIDESGNPKIGALKDGKVSNMQVRELIEGMYNDDRFAGAFPGSGNSGTGATGHQSHTQSSGKSMTRTAFESLAPTDRQTFMNNGGKVTD